MGDYCLTCTANHKILEIEECFCESVRKEDYYKIRLKTEKILSCNSTQNNYDWDWGCIWYNNNANEESLIIITSDGQKMINWSLQYEENYAKTSFAKSRYIQQHFPHILQTKTYIHDGLIYSLEGLNDIPKQHFYHEGNALHILVFLQSVWRKTIKAKRHNKRYRTFIFMMFKYGSLPYETNIYVLKYIISLI